MSLRSLCIHTCSLVKASVTKYSGQNKYSWTGAGVVTLNDVTCRWQPVQMISEIRERPTGSQIGDYELWIPFDDAPDALKTHGSEDIYRVTNLKDENGNVIDAGPFDIDRQENQAGHSHHVKLNLLRTG